MPLNIHENRLKYDFKYYVENRIFIPYTKKRYIITPLHENTIKDIMDHPFVIFLAYRGFGKSEIISYAFALWRAEMWNESSLILSANENLAYMKLDLIRNAIESDNPELRYMYSGDISSYTWNRGEINLIDKKNPMVHEGINREGQVEQKLLYNIKAKIYARSLFSANRGIHVENIIGDDIVVEQNSNSFDLLQQTKDIFHRAITPIRKPDSRMIVVGTPQSDEDLLSSLRKNAAFHKIEIPALNIHDEPTCPQLHSKAFLSEQRQIIGERAWQQEYMLKPITEINSDFTWEILNKTRNFNEKVSTYYEKAHKEKIFIGTDFSIKDKKEEADSKDTDYFSLCAVAFNTETKKRRVLNMHRERGIGFEKQISMAISWYYRYGADGLCTEKHGFLDIFNQITEKVASDIIIFDTGTNSGKFDKVAGIPSMKWEFEKELWEFPCGDPQSLELTNILFKELNQLEASKHDDMADALFRADKACIKSSIENSISYTPSQEKVQQKILNLGRVW